MSAGKMQYSVSIFSDKIIIITSPIVRLGTSGLKVSKIILGCMTYGTPEMASWMLDEEEGKKHIKAA